MPIARRRSSVMLAVALAALLLPHASARAFDVVMSTQGEFMDAYLVNGHAFPPRVAFNQPDPVPPSAVTGTPPRGGRHLNGALCFFPSGVGHNHQYVVADDAYREACLDTATPQGRCTITKRGSRFFMGKDPDGWGVFNRKGRWKKRNIFTAWPAVATAPPGQGHPNPEPQGNIDPQGCVFDAQGNLFGNDVGSGDPTNMDPNMRGSLVVFFPGPRHRYDTYCFLDKNIAQAGMPVMDAAGSIIMAEEGMGRVLKYSPPFPSSAADCPGADHLVTTAPTKTTFTLTNSLTPGGIVRAPGTDHWYVSSTLLPGIPGQGGGSIDEYNASFTFVRNIVSNIPPGRLLNPLGVAVGSDGTLYYSELNLNVDTSTGCGRVSQVRFVGGTPQAPEVLGQNLSFPDGVTVVDSSLLRVNFLTLPVAPEPDPATCNGSGG